MALSTFKKLVFELGPYSATEKGAFVSVISSAALSPAQVAAATVAEESFAFAGVEIGDIVLRVEKPTHQAGLAVVGGRVDAAGAIVVSFVNATAAPITPTASQVYKAVVLRIN